MAHYIEKAEKLTLPLVVLNGTVAFPAITVNFELSDKANVAAIEAANSVNSFIFIVSRKHISNEPLDLSKVFNVGTVAKIKQSIKTPEGKLRVIAEGFARGVAEEYRDFANYRIANVMCKTITVTEQDDIRVEALTREAVAAVEKMSAFLPAPSKEVLSTMKTIRNPGALADFIASNILVRHTDKQEILSIFEPLARLERLIVLLEEETSLLECEKSIHKEVRARLNQNQKEYYLREQLRVIKEQLGETAESDDYIDRIIEMQFPEEIEAKLLKDAERTARLPFGSAELSVMRTYFDTVLDIPWKSSTKDRTDIAAASKILERDHDGLDEVKKRILEFLAVKELNPDLKNQIICLVGPPGVGKTSIAASIATAMKRKYVRVSLGGVRDEADIRGHRKTYVGAMPGRIINALIQAKVNNPLILLDEIDKLTRDAHGDPTSALLEVLDGEQNKAFRDHFVELPFDLSGCFFIATANTLDTIPRPLIDRMEIIEIKIYTKREKLSIAKNHLIPKQLKRHGLNKRTLKISDSALEEMIDHYTREAGVRNLERTIASLCRKAAHELVSSGAKSVNIKAENIAKYLGERKYIPEKIDDYNEIGTVNGLAYTELGGDMLKIEVAALDGTGKIELTGSLGEVMKESAQIAISYVRSVAKEYGIPADFYKTKDIHIHAPEGAVPKDGPSAGVTMVTALISELASIPVRRDVAMTGEITLRGKVLPIGGLKEKTMAAYNAGVKTVLIPHGNLKDLNEIDPLARESLEFIPCKTLSDVLDIALIKQLIEPIFEETIPHITKNESAPIGAGIYRK
ncbi:MAG: endopeptidase La [Clostridia bacterium]|nr:endopeptidase La [Clostridia bacterium]